MSFIKIALRNIPRRKLRNALTIAAILLSVALFVGINVATDSAVEEFERYVERSWGETDIVVIYGIQNAPFSEENLSLAQSVDGIEKAFGRLELHSYLFGDGGKIIGVKGVDLETDYEYESYEVSGNRNVSENNIVATQALCDEYGLKIGDNLNVLGFFITTGVEDNLSTSVYNLRIIGTFKPLERIELTQVGFIMELGYLQSVMEFEGQINVIYAKVSDIERTGEIKEEIQELLGSEFNVITPKIDATDEIKGQMESFTGGLDLVTTISLIICAFIVFNTMLITVKERTYEIGVLRATGSSRFQIFRMFFIESLLLGAAGICLGIIGGLALSKFFIWLIMGIFSGGPAITTFVLTSDTVQMGILTGFMAVFAGALYPAISACRISVDQALRPGMRLGRGEISTIVPLAAGVMLFIFGATQVLHVLPYLNIIPYLIGGLSLFMGAITISAVVLLKVSTTFSKSLPKISGSVGMLVSRNVGRKILRNAVCFGAIGMSLSFVIMMGGIKVGVVEAMELGVRESFGCDLILISTLPVPLTFEQDLTSRDDVRSVTPLSVVPMGTKCLEPENKSIGVIVIDPETFPDIIQYDFIDPQSPDEAYQKMREDNETLILPKALATELGVSVGDNMTLQTLPTPNTTDYTVAGIFKGTILQHVWIAGHALSESIIISFDSQTKNFYPLWGEGMGWSFFVNVEPGAEPAEVLEQIDNAYPQYRFDVNSVTFDDILESSSEQIDRIFFILFSALYFSVLIVTIGVAIAMVMNVTERKREIGILRSQGASGRQILSMFLGEALILGIIGFVIGMPCGMILLKGVVGTMTFDGLNIRLILAWGAIIQALILALVAAIGGALYPAYRASKITVIESLQRK